VSIKSDSRDRGHDRGGVSEYKDLLKVNAMVAGAGQEMEGNHVFLNVLKQFCCFYGPKYGETIMNLSRVLCVTEVTTSRP
jgi:hypothetical protein